MGDERRTEKRYSCKECEFQELKVEREDIVKVPFTLVDRSARGLCGFYVGDKLIAHGDRIFVLRKGIMKVYYQVRWCDEVFAKAYRFGLKIMDSKGRSRHQNSKYKFIDRFKYDDNITHNVDINCL
ncbi:MAG: PilZ domain-containing protein [Planctomycetes bacterium]|nr:PilZ domain-containing protein [Planctomycetota bacterium]